MKAKDCAVDVISVCSADGSIRPLRIQLKDEQHQILRINIDEVISCRQIQHIGAEAQIFCCRASVWDRQWIFELKYTIRVHTWCFMRRIQ